MTAEEKREYARKWRAMNPEKAREIDYRSRKKHRARFDAYQKSHKEKNRSRYSAYQKEHRNKNSEHHKLVRKQWEEKNRGKVNSWSSKRRAKLAKCSNPDAVEAFYIKAKSSKSFVCFYCAKRLKGKPDIDHIVPISRGGEHEVYNLCVSCEPCNCSKKDKLLSEWKPEGQLFLV